VDKIEVEEIDYYINYFERNKIPFKIYQTLNTAKIVTANEVLTYTNKINKLNNYELNLIRKVKKCAENLQDMPSTEAENVKYIDVSKLINTNKVLTAELFELDLNSAYWENAYNNFFIDKETYLYGQGKKIGKKARLISLGALAKTTTVQEFDGEIYKDLKPIKTTTKGVFFECANICSLEMNILKIIAENNFLFFWVDAVFFRGVKTREKIETYLQDKGIAYKIYPLEKVKANKKDATITVYSEIHKKHERKFNFSKNKKNFIKIMKNTLIKFTCRDEARGIYFTRYQYYNRHEAVPTTHIDGVKIIQRDYEEKKKYICEMEFQNKYTNSVMKLQFNYNTPKELFEITKHYFLSNKENYTKNVIL
jgi:hypothetical protein